MSRLGGKARRYAPRSCIHPRGGVSTCQVRLRSRTARRNRAHGESTDGLARGQFGIHRDHWFVELKGSCHLGYCASCSAEFSSVGSASRKRTRSGSNARRTTPVLSFRLLSPRDINSVRRSLYECEPEVTVEVLQLLIKNNGCSQEVIQDLLQPPRMKEHLASKTWHLTRLKLKLADPKPKQDRPPAALLERFDREKLYEQVWSQPMRTVAQAYAVSDVWLAKVCRRLKIPVPGRGYWAKKAAGMKVGRRPKLQQIDWS